MGKRRGIKPIHFNWRFRMRIQYRILVLSVSVLLAGAAFLPVLAIQKPGVSLDTPSGPPGTYVTLYASGFTPDQTADLLWDGAPIAAAEILKDGTATAGFSVPMDAAGGDHQVTLRTKTEEASAYFTVTIKGPTDTPVPSVPSPLIKAFYLDSASITAGQCTTLHWVVEEAVNAVLSGDFGTQEVELIGEMQVCPSQTTTYQLLAAGQKGAVPDTATAKTTLTVTSPPKTTHTPTPTLTVTSPPKTTYTPTPTQKPESISPPVIKTFQLDSGTVIPGQCTALRWVVENAVQINLSGDFDPLVVDPTGERKVCPAQTIVYQLVATGQKGAVPETASAKVVLTVGSAPQRTFTPTPTVTLTPTTQAPLLPPQIPGNGRCTDLDIGPGAFSFSFDSRANGEGMTDQYRANGVMFTAMSAYAAIPPMGARSDPIAITSGFGDLGSYMRPISMVFTTPMRVVGMFVGREAPSGSSRAVFAVLSAYDYSASGGPIMIGRSRVQLPNAASRFEYCLSVQASEGHVIRSATLEYSSAIGVSVMERRWMDNLAFIPAGAVMVDNPPQVTISYPANGGRVTTNNVGLVAQIREDIRLANVSMSVNGGPLRPIGARPSAGGDPTRYETNAGISDLNPDADNTVRVVATDSGGQTGEATTSFSYNPPAEGDIWITGYETTQSIQLVGDGVPLIGNKKTVVRVYIQSRDDIRGGWNDVSAVLTVGGRTYLPANTTVRWVRAGSGPPTPVIAAPVAGSARNNLESGFYFILDRADTAPGDRTFEVRIFTPSGRPEADSTNNTRSISQRFFPQLSISIYGVPYVYQPTERQYYERDSRGVGHWLWPVPQHPWSNFEGHRAVVEAMLPIAQFNILPVPGLATLPATVEAYGLPPALPPPAFASLDTARAWADETAARISDNAKVYLLEPAYDRYQAGETSGNRRRINGHDNRDADLLGFVMAHEVCHAYGLWWHVVSPPEHTADLPNDEYLHSHGSIGWQIGINMSNPTAPQVVAPAAGDHVHDLMVYGGPPIWISPYTYCALMESLGGPSGPGCAGERWAYEPALWNGNGSTRLASLAITAEQPYLYISGWINADGGAEFNAIETILSKDNLASTAQTGDYTVVLEDAAGKAIGFYPFLLDTSDGEDAERTLFSVIAPDDPAIARVTLRNMDAVLAERTRSSGKPEVTVASPNGGETWSGMQTIIWQAVDSDGETLTYSVEYSPNGGESWLPLGTGLAGESYSANFDAVPGSDQALVRVMASDGINSGWDVSDAAFSVPRKGPQVTLGAPQEGATFTEAQPFVASATGYDWEDGVLDDAAFYWSSDRDGSLGQGPWIAIPGLTAGEHVLTVTARDRDGNESTASVHLTVGSRTVEVIAVAGGPSAVPALLRYAVLFGLIGGGLLIITFAVVGVAVVVKRRMKK
jgi:hypothetical protein